MSEFYMNLNKQQIEDLIKDKLKIYDSDFECMPLHIKLSKTSFEAEAVTKYYKLVKCDIYRYIGVHNGSEIYHFYNIVT